MAYKKEWYDKKRKSKIDSANALIPIVFDLIRPSSVIDIGCGDGTWLSLISEHGINNYLGVDGDWIDKDLLQIPKENFKVADLTKPLEIEKKFDLAISLEVAEHLSSEYAELFVKTLTRVSNVILFSAAIPFQGGTKHFNEQWQSYWAKLFLEKGFRPVDIIRNKIWNNENILPFYKQNIVLYIKDYKFNKFSFEELDKVEAPSILDKVHPEIFEMKMQAYEDSMKFKSTFKRLIKGALHKFIKSNK
ncbi:MAG: class I SAM-dependent methyltransferase [Pseudomonadota bacterium]|nr:class I SAM-dependent methyltransferase [Pseudomonadota bacterium]